VPHFIEDYHASSDIFTRAMPLLALIFLLEMFAAVSLDWPWWGNVLAVAAGFALLLGAWAAVNRLRGRPQLSLPDRVGAPELAVFVLVPPLVPLLIGGELGSAAATIAGNLALLGVIYLGTSYGIIPILRWATARIARQLGSTLGLFARAIPLLLLFVTFLFINAEVWQVVGGLRGEFYVATIALFGGFAVVFMLFRLPREVKELAAVGAWPDVVGSLHGTPLAGYRPRSPDPSVGEITRRRWVNVGLLVLFGQSLQVVLVAGLVGLFLAVFGALAIDPLVIEAWTEAPVHSWFEVRLWERTIPITEELLRVAGFLTAFSGLYFTVTGVTDPALREEFFEDVVGEVRQAFCVRAAYVDILAER
jgi:hypothetical protein